MLRIFTALSFSLLPNISQANYLNGGELLEFCDSSPMLVGGYFIGVYDALQAMNNNLGTPMVCVPEGLPASDGAEIACDFLRDNSASRDHNAATAIYAAFQKSHPCP